MGSPWRIPLEGLNVSIRFPLKSTEKDTDVTILITDITHRSLKPNFTHDSFQIAPFDPVICFHHIKFQSTILGSPTSLLFHEVQALISSQDIICN